MTDTTQVPTALLERLRDNITRRTNDGWLQETYVTGTIVQELVALIPAPAQVGDKPTASQIRALPLRTVLRDPDGDIYVIGEDVDKKQKIIGVVNDDFVTFTDEYTPEQVALYSGVIIALPEEQK